LRIHLTFFVVPLISAYQWGATHGWAGAFFGVAVVLLLFTAVALHELGHALVARWFGIPVSAITLLPIGGVAALEGRPRTPFAEAAIAIAGPAVNFLLAVPLFGLTIAHALLYGLPSAATVLEPSWGTLLLLLSVGNLALGLFNLLPVFPLDGGRVLRALLSTQLGEHRATRWASGTGQVAAAALFAWAVFTLKPLLALIAVFLFLAAGRERREADLREWWRRQALPGSAWRTHT
jgi:stage IV sporulation protein FB